MSTLALEQLGLRFPGVPAPSPVDEFNPASLLTGSNIVQRQNGLDLTGQIGQRGQNFGTVGLSGQQAIRAIFGFDPGLDRNGSPIPSAYGYGDSRTEPNASPQSLNGAAFAADGLSYAFIQPDNIAREATALGLPENVLREATAVEEVAQKLLYQALPLAQNEVIGDAVAIRFDQRLSIKSFMELALQATGRANLPARYQEVLNTSTAALDALAGQYGIQGRADASAGLVLTERYLNYLNRDGSWDVTEINFNTLAQFAKDELGVQNGQQFTQSFQNQFLQSFTNAANRILAPLQPRTPPS